MGRKKISGIYIITCLRNNKHYIGKSVNILRRLTKHKTELVGNYHLNAHLQSSVNKYGIENFEFSILEEWDIPFINSMENYWCNLLQTHNREFGYNKQPTGPYGHNTHSNETKLKISLRNKGRASPMKGRHQTEEAKKKMSISKMGNTYTKGKKMPETMKEKLREIHKGKTYHPPIKHSDKTKRLLSEMKKGKSLSSEHRKNVSTSLLKKANNPIVQLDRNLNFVKLWRTASIMGRELNILDSQISEVLSGKHSHAHGFTFIKKEEYDKGILPKKPNFYRNNRKWKES